MKHFQEKLGAATAFMQGDYWKQVQERFKGEAGYTIPKLTEYDPYNASELMKKIFPLGFSRVDDDGKIKQFQMTLDEFHEILEYLQGTEGVPKLKLT